eukprot:11349063-Karenia_brevis.AAC.1
MAIRCQKVHGFVTLRYAEINKEGQDYKRGTHGFMTPEADIRQMYIPFPKKEKGVRGFTPPEGLASHTQVG